MPSVLVAAGVLVRGDDVLICQRRPTDRHPGKWEFPGGKIEAGETPPDCIVRELREELDIEAVAGRELWRTRHRYPELVVELVFVHVERFHREPQNLCFSDMRWVPRVALPTYDLLDADRDFAARFGRGDIAL